jgi:hypothetical protein
MRKGLDRAVPVETTGGNPSAIKYGGYLIASGLTGEPTAPVIGSAGATNRNS